jgi:hypothetical protein
MGEDVTDCALIDVRAMDLEDLLSHGDESGLSKALERILAASSERANSFQSSI